MLTDKQRKYVEGVARGLSSTEAARQGGYAYSSPQSLRVQASRLANDPDIQQAIFEHRQRRLQNLAGKALATLEGILDDPTAPPAARMQAVKWTMEACGFGIENRRIAVRHPEDDNKPLSNYTLAEIEEMAELAATNLKRVQGQVIEVSDFVTE